MVKLKNMIVSIELEVDDLNAMHDVILEALGIEPTEQQILEYFNMLPDHIKGTAIAWGTSDTIFRDEMFEWLEEYSKK